MDRQCAVLRESLLDDIQNDIDSFRKYKTALALPKVTQEESAVRNAAMQNGLKAAVQTPLEVAEKSVKALALCREAIEKGNRNAGPDALVGALLLRAAILGAVYNIRINVKTITDGTVPERDAEPGKRPGRNSHSDRNGGNFKSAAGINFTLINN